MLVETEIFIRVSTTGRTPLGASSALRKTGTTSLFILLVESDRYEYCGERFGVEEDFSVRAVCKKMRNVRTHWVVFCDSDSLLSYLTRFTIPMRKDYSRNRHAP